MTGYGLRRLGATREEFVGSDPRSYRGKVQWARGLHSHPSGLDGLQWVSRQFDRALFGDRVAEDDLLITPGTVPTLLSVGPGLEEVLDLADQADLTLI